MIDSYERSSAVLDLVNEPYEAPSDMDEMNSRWSLVDLMFGKARLLFNPDVPSWENFDLIKWLIAMTSTKQVPGEKWQIVSFANSTDMGVKRLRDTVGLPPPAGGAIVRVYAQRSSIPKAISPTLPEGLDSTAIFCRYVAVCTEGRAPEQVNEMISRRLVESYINSYGGVKSFQLPDWFINGVSLYLSNPYLDPYSFNPGSRLEYYLHNRYLSDEEQDYRLVFYYLEKKYLKEYGMSEFIKQSIEDGSTDSSMVRAVGVSSYEILKMKALKDEATGQRDFILVSLFILAVVVFGFLALLDWRFKTKRLHRLGVVLGLAYDDRFPELESVEKKKIDRLIKELKLFDKGFRPNDSGFLYRDNLEAEGKLEDLALAMVNHARLLANEGKKTEAEMKLDAAAYLAPWSSAVKSAIEEARGPETSTES